jgi:hypothetical protein
MVADRGAWSFWARVLPIGHSGDLHQTTDTSEIPALNSMSLYVILWELNGPVLCTDLIMRWGAYHDAWELSADTHFQQNATFWPGVVESRERVAS